MKTVKENWFPLWTLGSSVFWAGITIVAIISGITWLWCGSFPLIMTTSVEILGWALARGNTHKNRAFFPRPYSAIYCFLRKEHDWILRTRFRSIGEDQFWCRRCHDVKYVSFLEETS